MDEDENHNDILSLANKVALVTGAARGIGCAIAERLAADGATVVRNDASPPSDAETQFIRADVSNVDQVAAMFREIEVRFGSIDILVNNAGISSSEDIFSITPDSWHRVMDTNLTSAFLCSKEAMQRMRATGGHIINITSVVARQGALMGHAHYAASKAGMIGLTTTLARTGAAFGIRVNAVAPGIIDTDLLQSTHGADGIAKLAASIPLGVGKPDDVAHAVAFLLGPGGRYITGATLDVNGGLFIG